MNILHKLTLKNLRMNKSRTIVTIVGIMLSAALITMAASAIVSAKKTLSAYAEKTYGNYDVSIDGDFDDNAIKKLELNRNIESVYKADIVGVALFENSKSSYRHYIAIEGLSPEAFENGFDYALEDGRYPQTTDEVVLSPTFVKNSEKEYKVGDKITLEVGRRAWDWGEEMKEALGDDSDEMLFAQFTGYMPDNEKFIPEFTAEYTVTGILKRDGMTHGEDGNTSNAFIYTAADFSTNNRSSYAKVEGSNWLYLRFTEEGEKNYLSVISDITGIDEKTIHKYENSQLFDEANDKFYKDLLNCEYHITRLYINSQMLKLKLINLDVEIVSMIYGIAAAVLAIIIVSSIFIIRNSFRISVTEKTKLYGMLSTTGATPRQIRRNVFFEGFLLGIIGIPLGLIIGIGGTALLVTLFNGLLSEVLNGTKIIFSISWLSVLVAVVLGAMTIFLSALSAAVRASRIPPIEAIRSNKDVKITKKGKAESYRTPKWITKLFGIGGGIAWKNIKRSRRQYRSTVISITVSIAVYLSVYSFVAYAMHYYEYIQKYDYNMTLCDFYYEYYGEEGNSDYLLKDEELFKTIGNFDEVEKYFYVYCGNGYTYNIPTDMISKEIRKAEFTDVFSFTDEKPDEIDHINFTVVAVDDNTYGELAKRLDCDYDSIKNKGILVNSVTGYMYSIDDNGEEEYEGKITEKYMNDPVGYVINAEYQVFEEAEYIEESGDWGSFSEEIDKNDEQKVYGDISIEIGAQISDSSVLDGYSQSMIDTNGAIIVTMDWLKKNYPEELLDRDILYLWSNDSDLTEQKMDFDGEHYSLRNYAAEARNVNSVSLVAQISVYGFISIITLIGLTNIFNTITTNMKLRQKEFAMLRSVGMTNREFDRMIALESLFYTMKSLLLGIPIGLIGGYIVYRTMNSNPYDKLDYMFPWLAVLVCVIAVLAVVWFIMFFSIRKVHKQNIIETIRNDNI